MKNITKLTLMVMSLTLFGCAGMMRQPLPNEFRTTSYTFNSTKNKLDLYQSIKFWLPTTIKSNGQLIQAEDKDSGKISGTGYIPCRELPGSLMAEQLIEFQYLVSATNKKLEIKFFNQRIYVANANHNNKDVNLFNDKSQLEGAKSCFDKLTLPIKDLI
jgi:hypothetical protein